MQTRINQMDNEIIKLRAEMHLGFKEIGVKIELHEQRISIIENDIKQQKADYINIADKI